MDVASVHPIECCSKPFAPSRGFLSTDMNPPWHDHWRSENSWCQARSTAWVNVPHVLPCWLVLHTLHSMQGGAWGTGRAISSRAWPQVVAFAGFLTLLTNVRPAALSADQMLNPSLFSICQEYGLVHLVLCVCVCVCVCVHSIWRSSSLAACSTRRLQYRPGAHRVRVPPYAADTVLFSACKAPDRQICKSCSRQKSVKASFPASMYPNHEH